MTDPLIITGDQLDRFGIEPEEILGDGFSLLSFRFELSEEEGPSFNIRLESPDNTPTEQVEARGIALIKAFKSVFVEGLSERGIDYPMTFKSPKVTVDGKSMKLPEDII